MNVNELDAQVARHSRFLPSWELGIWGGEAQVACAPPLLWSVHIKYTISYTSVNIIISVLEYTCIMSTVQPFFL